jgi:hypothetical protein
MSRDELIKKLINENLELCRTNCEVNDGMIFDLLMYGFKGFEKMTIEELQKEWNDLCNVDEEVEND